MYANRKSILSVKARVKLFTEQEYEAARRKHILPGKCDFCGEPMNQIKKKWQERKIKKNINDFCSYDCHKKYSSKMGSSVVRCKNCDKKFKKTNSQIKQSSNHFCSSSCAATYNNTHKTHGTRRSKLEVWLADQLPQKFPGLDFIFNGKETINSELDIYIPSLRLAFELNGIFHYEPIYGQDKLESIQNNDTRKAQACWERGIEFCTIDVSNFKYFKTANAQKYLDIVIKVINARL